MTKRYSILQAKLQELESILNDALLHGPDIQSHETLSNDIKQKLAFIGNLLSAEVASHPSKPHHLEHISQRLAALEKAFHQWDTFRAFSYQQEFDKESTCSCTESCLNDDGEALDETGLIVYEDPEERFLDFSDEKALVKFNGGLVQPNGYVEEDKEIKKSKVGFDKMPSFVYEDAVDFFEDFAGGKQLVELDSDLLKKREEEGKNVKLVKDELHMREERRDEKICCALTIGVVFGMVLIVFLLVTFADCFYYVKQTSCAIPT